MPHLHLASRLCAAIEQNDLDGIRAVYAPDVRVWHNTDGLDFPGQTVEENLKVLAWMQKFLTGMRYDIVARAETATGFVQQHVLRATMKDTGEAFALPACIVCTVVDDRIVRLDEYLDSAHVAMLGRAAEAARAAKS